MKDLLEMLKDRLADDETRRYVRFFSLPFVAVILILVIVAVDGTEKAESPETKAVVVQEESETVQKTEEVTVKPETKDTIPVIAREESPEILELMEAYFKARRACDLDALNQVFGGACPPEELARYGQKLEEEVKYYQDYQDLTCFSAPGLEDGEYVVYADFLIKFRQADTPAPSLMACYVKSNADGRLYLSPVTSDEEAAYIGRLNQTKEVQTLAKEINNSLKEALGADENLLSVYHFLMDGKGQAPELAEDTQAASSEGETELETDAP